MGRSHRAAEGGYLYHVLNRANARMTIFEAPGDYETGEYEAGDREAFEQFLAEAVERTGTRLLAYTLMPNHWHLPPRPVFDVVWPRKDGELSRSVARGRPFGDEAWSDRTVRRLGLESTLRPQGRPKQVGPGRSAGEPSESPGAKYLMSADLPKLPLVLRHDVDAEQEVGDGGSDPLRCGAWTFSRTTDRRGITRSPAAIVGRFRWAATRSRGLVGASFRSY